MQSSASLLLTLKRIGIHCRLAMGSVANVLRLLL